MLATSARLLQLLSLLQTRRDWPGPELAERLEVRPRTVRRDVERLRRLGYPVQARPGVAGGYRLGAGASLPPPSDWLGGLAVYVADIGVDFEVLEPPEFIARVQQLAKRFGRATPK